MDSVDLIAQQLGLWGGLPAAWRAPLAWGLAVGALVLVGVLTRDKNADADQLGPGTWRLQVSLVNTCWLLPHPFRVLVGAVPFGPMANICTHSWGLLFLCFDVRVLHLVPVDPPAAGGQP